MSELEVQSPIIYTETQTEVTLNSTSPLSSDYAFSDDERASMVAVGGKTLHILDSNSGRARTARMQSGGRKPAVIDGNVVIPGTNFHNQAHVYNLSSGTFAFPDDIYSAWGTGTPYYAPQNGTDFYVHGIFNTVLVTLKPDEQPEDYELLHEGSGGAFADRLTVFNSSVGTLRMTKFSASHDFAVEGNTLFVSHVPPEQKTPQYNGLVAYDLEADNEVWFRSYSDELPQADRYEYYDGRLIGYRSGGQITEVSAENGTLLSHNEVDDVPGGLSDLTYVGSDRFVFELSAGHESPNLRVDVPENMEDVDKNDDGNITFLDWHSDSGYVIVDRDTGDIVGTETTEVDFKSRPSHPTTVGPDGQYLYYVADRTVRVVDMDTGETVTQFTPAGQPQNPYNGTLNREEPRISGVHATADGLRLVVGDEYYTYGSGMDRSASYAQREVRFAPHLYDSVRVGAATTDCCVRFTLTRFSGSPASDVTVSLDGETVTTNENGTAQFDKGTFASLANDSKTGDRLVNATLSVQDEGHTSEVLVTAVVTDQAESGDENGGDDSTTEDRTAGESGPGFTMVSLSLAAAVLALLAGRKRG